MHCGRLFHVLLTALDGVGNDIVHGRPTPGLPEVLQATLGEHADPRAVAGMHGHGPPRVSRAFYHRFSGIRGHTSW